LASTGFESFTIFLYADGRIQWTTGDNSGGDDGLGGTEALAGINDVQKDKPANVLPTHR